MRKEDKEKEQISAGIDQATLERLAHVFGICLYKLNLDTKDIRLTLNTTRATGHNIYDLPTNNETKGSMIYEDDRGLVDSSVYSIVSGQKDHYHIEYRMRRNDSSIVWFEEVGLISEYDAEGRPLYMSALAIDLSRLKWAEEKARSMESEARSITANAGAFSQSMLADENRLLRASNAAAAMIIGGFHQEYETVLHQSIQMLGESLNANYACMWRNSKQNDEMYCSLRAHWTTKARSIGAENNGLYFKYDDFLPGWNQPLTDKKYHSFNADILSKKFTDACNIDNSGNIVLAPIYLHNDFWGMMGFCRKDGAFMDYEIDAVMTGAIIIASSVSRNETFGKINLDRDKAIATTLAKGEFLSRMSHELRTPLNAIIGMSSIALKEKDAKKIPEYIKKVESSSQLLLNVINDILDMSKIEAGKLEFINEPFDFNAMLRSAESIIRVKMNEKKQRFTINYCDGLAKSVISDEHRLLQVIVNLLSNAVKFSPENGEIKLSASQRPIGENRVRLRVDVCDNGIGLTPEQQNKLFRAFEQADGSITRRYGGTGLGLAICKEILNGLGGNIWVKSRLNEGACFYFELDVDLSDAALDGQDSTDSENSMPDFSGLTILLAEDVEINREIVELLLAETNVKIVSAVNGKQAVDKFLATPPLFDLILMDVQMPIMDGLAATALIRACAEPKAKSIPIIAMTANAFKEDVEMCIKSGMNGHIAKPIVAKDFIVTLKKYLSR